MAKTILSILQNASSWGKLLMEEPINVEVFGVGSPKDQKENAGGKSGNVIM